MLKKIKRLGYQAVLPYELNAVFARSCRFHEVINQTQALQWKVAKRHQGFTNVISGEFFFLHDQDVMSVLGKQGTSG